VAINLVCPDCGATQKVPDTARGKRFRCKECGHLLDEAEESRPARKKPAAAVEDDALQPAPRRQPTVPAARRRREEEEEDAPRRDRGRRPAPRPSSALPLIIGGCVAAGVLVLGGVGVLAYFLLQQPADVPPAGPGPVAFNPLPQPPPAVPPPPPQEKPRPEPPRVDPAQRQDPLREPPKVDPPRRDPPKIDPPRRDPPPAEAAVWKVQADPAPQPVKLAAGARRAIPVPGPGQDVLFPSTPSPLAAIGKNIVNNDSRVVWDLSTGKSVGTLAGKIDLGDPLALGPDGKYLAGVPPTERRVVDVWNITSGKPTRLQVSDVPVFLDLLDFAGPDKLVVGKGGPRGKVFQIWDIPTSKMDREIDGPAIFDRESAAFSPGRKYLACTANGKLLVYDLQAGALAGSKPLPKPEGFGVLMCKGLQFSPDGAELAGLFNALDKTRVLSWDVAKGEIVADRSFEGDLKLKIKNAILYRGRALDWLTDRSGWLVYGQVITDHDSDAILGSVPANDPIPGPRRIIDADHLAVVGGNNNAKQLELVSLPWEQIKAARANRAAGGQPPGTLPAAKPGDWSAVRVMPVAGAAGAWQADADPPAAANGKLAEQPLPLQVKDGHVQRLLFSGPATGQVAVLSTAKEEGPLTGTRLRVDCYDLSGGKHLGGVDKLPGEAGNIPHAAFSPDGSTFAQSAPASREPARVDVWSMPEGKHLVGWLTGDKEGGNRIVSWLAALDGKRVLTATLNRQITLWTLPECRAVWSLDAGVSAGLAVSPGRKYLAVPVGEGFDLLEIATGERRGRLAGLAVNEQVRAAAAAFSPDGKELAALFRPQANTGGSVLLARWDTKTGKLLAQFPLPPLPPSLVCSAPGKREGVWSASPAAAPTELTWWGKEHLLLNHSWVLDTQRKWFVWRLQPPNRGGIADNPPDERVWFAADRGLNTPVLLTALAVPAEFGKTTAEAADGRAAALVRPGMAVSLKMDWNVDGPPGDAAGFRQKLTDGLTRWLQGHGVTVKDGQTNVLAVRVAVVDSDKSFEVREVFGPLGRPLPGMPRGRPDPDKTFKAKRLMAQVLYSDGKSNWQINQVFEPGTGTVGKDEDPATYQLNRQWAALATWLATDPLPYFVSGESSPAVLPGLSSLTPDGVKQVPRK
jgi:WD40 repeat protein